MAGLESGRSEVKVVFHMSSIPYIHSWPRILEAWETGWPRVGEVGSQGSISYELDPL